MRHDTILNYRTQRAGSGFSPQALLSVKCAQMPREVSEKGVPIAFEDKFLVFAFGKAREFCPHPYHSEHLGEMLYNLQHRFGEIVPVFDLRGLEGYYTDVDEFIDCVGQGEKPLVLLGAEQVRQGWDEELRSRGLRPMRVKGRAHASGLLDLKYFDEEATDFEEEVRDEFDEEWMKSGDLLKPPDYDVVEEATYKAQQDALYDFLLSRHRHSLLVEFAMQASGDQIAIAPYHGHAVHEVETQHDIVVVGRPGVIAKTTGAVFSSEIARLECLINDPQVRELQIQRFLEGHPNFLRGLNYRNIYPQVVLEREGQGPLKPDFILEPFADAFCDILDVKLPSQKVVIGRKDRATLAAGLHEVAAQLREYAAYFEQDKYRRLVQQKYGLRLYRPRLIALVGRDMRQMSREQYRRAMTCYENLQVMTFDELLKHARKRILL